MKPSIAAIFLLLACTVSGSPTSLERRRHHHHVHRPRYPDTIRRGSSLVAGSGKDRMVSRNGRYTLIMQTDCNLVLYNEHFRPVWDSRTYHRGHGCVMKFQRDCNLVVYDKHRRALWTSHTRNTRGCNGKARLQVQNDRNVVLYVTGGRRSAWHTGTYHRHRG